MPNSAGEGNGMADGRSGELNEVLKECPDRDLDKSDSLPGMASPRTAKRVLSLLATAAIVFAPAPAVINEAGARPSRPPTDSLAALILSPTFDEGVIRAEARFSLLQQFKRRVPTTTYATILTVAFVPLLLAASLRLSPVANRLALTVATSVASRAPPVSP